MSKQEFDTLRSHAAMVTGSSKGIGRAIALRLARAGADVIVCCHRSTAEAEVVRQQIEGMGRKSCVLQGDLGDPKSVLSLIEQAWSWTPGGLDILVNNAGADVLTGAFEGATFHEKLDQLWKVDVVGAIQGSRAVGTRMKSRGSGCIVNLGWDQAWHGMEGDAGEMFGPIKAAIMAYTKSLAKSLAPGVRVNCVAPGWIKTEWGEVASDYWQERAVQESLRGRWGTPDDVAAAVEFLVSPAADFITGQIIPVNGGFRSALQRDGG